MLMMLCMCNYDTDQDNELAQFQSNASERPQSRYTPEISAAAIRSIIQEEMEEQEVAIEDIPVEGKFMGPENHKHSLRYIEMKGFAWFTCTKGHNKGNCKRWPSAHSWCFIDLREQRICYRYTQDCNVHDCEADIGPEFTEESIREMAQRAVRQFLRRIGRLRGATNNNHDGNPRDHDKGGPHDEKRCSKCRRLGRSCWK